jgi:hypothetical protein
MINARDQFAENFRCLCQGTRDDRRPRCASGIIHYSICPAIAHKTIYQNSALVSPNSRFGSRPNCRLAHRSQYRQAAGAAEKTSLSGRVCTKPEATDVGKRSLKIRHDSVTPGMLVEKCAFGVGNFHARAVADCVVSVELNVGECGR